MTLPPAQVGGLPTEQRDNFPPFRTIAEAIAAEPALKTADERLLTAGATGLPNAKGPDTRVTNFDRLLNGPFLLTGPHLPYDSYTGDPIHRYYQMWQQSDCDPGDATLRQSQRLPQRFMSIYQSHFFRELPRFGQCDGSVQRQRA